MKFYSLLALAFTLFGLESAQAQFIDLGYRSLKRLPSMASTAARPILSAARVGGESHFHSRVLMTAS